MATPEVLHIAVVFSDAARKVQSTTLAMQAGATVAQAVRQSRLLSKLDDAQIDKLTLGIRGRKVAYDHVVCDGDRIEVCRPLKVDPKVARRQRFARQGAKSAGLFASRRSGAKAGY